MLLAIAVLAVIALLWDGKNRAGQEGFFEILLAVGVVVVTATAL